MIMLVGTGPQTAVPRPDRRLAGSRLAAAGVGFAIAVTAGILWATLNDPAETGVPAQAENGRRIR